MTLLQKLSKQNLHKVNQGSDDSSVYFQTASEYNAQTKYRSPIRSPVSTSIEQRRFTREVEQIGA